MEDCFARLISMATQGKSDDEIAAATGYPVDAVQTLREELQVADPAPMEDE